MRSLFLVTAMFALQSTTLYGAEKIEIRYEISVGGARVMKATYVSEIDLSAYNSRLSIKSSGMSKWLSDIKLDLSTKGSASGSELMPRAYNYKRVKNDKTRKRKVLFRKDGNIETEKTKFDATMKNAFSVKTLDPLTMLLTLGRSETPCKGQHRAFDGRDVFDVSFSAAQKTGEELVCNAVYTPVAGADFEDGEIEKIPYVITMRSLGNSYGFAPVKITGTSKGLPVAIEAKSIQINGKTLSN